MKELKNWFRKRVYPEKVNSEHVNRALKFEEKVNKKDKQHMKGNGVPLVVTYNSNFKNLSLLTLDSGDPETKNFHDRACYLLPKC